MYYVGTFAKSRPPMPEALGTTMKLMNKLDFFFFFFLRGGL
jgi:hypothetical protein